jgi:HEAT repeat protein
MDDPGSTDTTFLYELAREGRHSELVGYLKRADRATIRRRAAELLGEFADTAAPPQRSEVVYELIAAVETDADDAVRAQAVNAIVQYGDEAFERLIEELADFEVGEASEEALRALFTDWLSRDYPELRFVAVTALGRFAGSDALPEIVGAFTDPDPRVRAKAVESCRGLADERCIDPLAERLEDSSGRVRREAAMALGAIGTERALEALIPATRADDEELRQIAVDELGQFDSLKPLVVLLRALDDPSDAVRRSAVLSIVQLFNKPPAERDGADEVPQTIVEQLDGADVPDVVPDLVDIVEETTLSRPRRNAAWLLGRLADDSPEEVQEALVDLLDAEHESTANVAAASLARLGGEGLAKRLRLFMQDYEEDSPPHRRAAAVLEEIGSDPESELVTNAVEYTYVRDPSDYTRQKRQDDADGDEPAA